MIADGHISPSEAAILLLFSITAKVFLAFPRIIARQAGTAGLVSVLLGGTIMMTAVLFFSLLARRFPQKNMVDIAKFLLGPYLGALFVLPLNLYFLFDTSIVLREFSETIATAVLPRTPLSVIVFLFVVLMAYSAYGGIEGIGRTAIVMRTFIVVFMAAIILLSYPRIVLGRLLPIFGDGLPSIIKSLPVSLSSYSEVIFLGLILPYIRPTRNVLKAGLMGIMSSALILSLFCAISWATFSEPLTAYLAFPFLDLTRLISFGHFLQRADVFFIFLWYFTAALKLSIGFYAFLLSLAEFLQLKGFRPLIFISAILTYAVSFLFPNLITSFWIDQMFLTRYTFVLSLTLPLVLWIIALFIGKKETQHG